MKIPANGLERTGYRLPTEGEWEYACRAGTVTSRYYGLSSSTYSRSTPGIEQRRRACMAGGSLFPNDLGLFDMLGNVYEWCHDLYERNRPATTGSVSTA